MQVADEYCARSLGAVAVAPVEDTVVVPDETALIVTCPAPIWMMLICVPIGYATDAFVGIEYVCADALDAVTSLSLSASTKV